MFRKQDENAIVVMRSVFLHFVPALCRFCEQFVSMIVNRKLINRVMLFVWSEDK